MIPKMHLPSFIINERELKERDELAQKLIKGDKDKVEAEANESEEKAFTYMKDWNRFRDLNLLHMQAVGYVTRYN